MATYTTFNDFFAGQRMTLVAASATVKANIPRVLPDAFYAPGPTKPFDDKVQWPKITWNRSGATVISRGSPPRNINVGQTDWGFATVLNMAEEMPVDFQFMQALASDFPMIRSNAEAELTRRMAMFNQRFDTTRTQITHSLFANGKVWVGSDGQILGSSSGAVITMDPGVPTGNKLTKDGSGGTYNIGDWSNAATDIQGALRTIQDTNVQNNGYVLTNISYGTNIPTYLLANTALQAYLKYDVATQQALKNRNEIPQGFLGFNWTPARLAYLAKADGTVTQTFPNNYLGIYPDITPDWYEFIEGGTQVPNGIASASEVRPNATFTEMANAFRIAYGKYAYGVVKSYPTVGQSMVQGDCCGPVLKTPGTFYFGVCS